MAEAKRRAEINALDNKGCWDELEGILEEHGAALDSIDTGCVLRSLIEGITAEHGAALDSPTPPRPYRPRVPTASAYDIEYRRAIKEARSRGLSS
jgi:hypothetical protein